MPDKHHDWLSQRVQNLESMIVVGDKKNKHTTTIFENYSLGANTNRDAWCYSASRSQLGEQMGKMINIYNSELLSGVTAEKATHESDLIKWSSSLVSSFERGKKGVFDKSCSVVAVYRPFMKQWLYFDSMFVHRMSQLPKIFPNADAENLVIHISGVGARSGFSVLISDCIPDIQHHDNGQCFPLYLYEESEGESSSESELFASVAGSESGRFTRRAGISDAALTHFQKAYPGVPFTKEDLFYYIYGLLHSPDYRSRYADNLGKELPRIPAVKTFADFRAFSQAGRELAHWHLE